MAYPAWAVPLGLAVAAAGGILVVWALERGSPAAIAASAGALAFILPGLWLAVYAGAYQLRRARASRSGIPPWRRDRRWNRRRVRDDGGWRALGVLAVGLFLAAFLTPLHLALVDAGDGGLPGFLLWVPWIGLGLFDLVVLAILGNGLWLLASRSRYGRTQVELHDFPFRPGGRVDVTFSGGRPLRRVEQFRAELNLVEEAHVASASTRSSSTPVWRSRHHESRTFELDDSGRARLAFDLPEAAPPNDMWADPPRYWELEVVGKAPGLDYQGLFVLPVYGEEEG